MNKKILVIIFTLLPTLYGCSATDSATQLCEGPEIPSDGYPVVWFDGCNSNKTLPTLSTG